MTDPQSKKTIISWVQPNFQQGPEESNAFYLPYSVGVIWAYCLTDPTIKQNFVMGELVWRRDLIHEVAAKLATSNIVAFSTYVWNRAYNYELARQVRELNPNALIVFGGPEPAIKNRDIFQTLPFIDIIIKLEGEITFKNILLSYDTGNFSHIPGLLINRGGTPEDTGQPDRISELDQIPSPYLEGIFDKIIAENPDIEWNGTLETNRGCPFACTFCDWGSLTYNKIKKFNLERVFAELEWMGQNRCGWFSIADANFGVFIERDSLIVDKIIEVQNKYQYPKSFSVAWAKNQKKDVVGLVKKLIDSPFSNAGLTLSVQSLDVDVLENIKRRNMEDNNLEEIFRMCAEQDVPTFTEIILGLPGETLATWRENFWKLYRLGNHNGLTVNHAQLLENSEMNLLQKKLFGITGAWNYDYFPGYRGADSTPESVEVVTGTKDMPTPDLLEAMLFSWEQYTWHLSGISALAARLVYKHLDIDYSEFYKDFMEFLAQDEWWRRERADMARYQADWLQKGKVEHPDIGGIEISGWKLIYRTVQDIQANQRHDHVFGLVEKFMQRYQLPERMIQDLMTLQRTYMIRYSELETYPKHLNLEYNVWEYVNKGLDLEQGKFVYCADFPEDKTMSMERFLDNYFFQRRRNFGKASIMAQHD